MRVRSRPAAASCTVIVLAKSPQPGRVKTRLVPPLTYDEAAELAAAALRDTLTAVRSAGFRRCVLSLAGPPADWLPAGWELHVQPGGGLDERIVAAFEFAAPGPVLLVGMDTPQITTPALLSFDPIQFDACVGPAVDGGYWLIGFTNPDDAADAVLGVVMSQESTGAEQVRRMQAAGLLVQVLDELSDVDTYEVACEVATDAPQTHFARAVRAVQRRTVA